MRIGRNPFKGAGGVNKAYVPKRITVAVLTYIPNFEGYYQMRFETLKISIASLIKNTEGEFDLLIFDNGSCPEVIEYIKSLYEQGVVDYLFLSGHNLGYNGALNFIYSVSPGALVAYADDDVFYHPGWLHECVTILETFPNVGYVTGCPVKNNFGHYDSATLAFAKGDTVNVKESSWDPKWDEIQCNSLGAEIQAWKLKYEAIDVPLLEYRGVEALPVSSHFQYVFKKEVSDTFLPFAYGNLMSSELNNPEFNMLMQLDKKLDDAGFLKLTTNGMFTEHLGNVISPRCKELIELYSLDIELPRSKSYNWFARLVYGTLSLPFIKKIFYLLYRFSFKVVHWKLIKKI